ncbi:MAG: hypothetical protein RLN76_06535 [Phycisphaeraceae bacterium]
MLWILLVIGLLMFWPIGMSLYYAEQRRLEMESVAESMGMTYVRRQSIDDDFDLKALPLMTLGRNHRCDNILQGEYDGCPVLIFDYTYTVRLGRSIEKHRQTVACYLLDGVAFPAISVRPEKLSDRLAGWMGYHDLDFFDSPSFSSKFWIQAKDETDARAVLDPVTQAYLLERPSWWVQIDGHRVLVFVADRVVKPDEIPAFFTESNGLIQRMLALAE